MIRKLTQGPRFLVNKINEIIDYSNRQTGIRGDGFINVNNSPEMPTVRLDINKLRNRIGRQLGGGGSGNVKWFQVTQTPTGDWLTCREATFDGTSFNNSGSDVQVRVNPQLDYTHYHNNDLVCACQVGGYWVSVYSQPNSFIEAP